MVVGLDDAGVLTLLPTAIIANVGITVTAQIASLRF